MNFTTSLEPAPSPAGAAPTAPGTAGPDPMRNAGYTACAYVLFLAAFAALLLRSRRRQRSLGARLGRLERSLGGAGEAEGAGAGGARQPLVRAGGRY